MEGVGARAGRSSSRYGTTTVFTGPVRKWKKKWVHVTPPPSSSTTSNSNNLNHHQPNGNSNSNGSNKQNQNRVRVYKWALVESGEEEEEEEGAKRKRKYKYIPIAVLEEQKMESDENTDDGDEKPTDNDTTIEPISKNGSVNEKPDINDVPMEDQDPEQNETVSERQDLNVSTLDLSLGLSSHEEEHESVTRAS